MRKILVITSYPEKNNTHGKATVGVASYAKNTLMHISKIAKKNLKLTVLAEKLPNSYDYTQNGIAVRRVWKRNSWTIFPNLLRQIRKEKDTKTILIEFELSMFGNILYLLPLPVFLLILKILKRDIIFVNHQVITNVQEIAPHINLKETTFGISLFNIGLSIFYRFLILVSKNIIVFEEKLKSQLISFGSSKKISVIPHGVEEFKAIPSKSDARKKLNIKKDEKIVLAFGYLAWYKGTDWLVDAISKINNNKKTQIKLILAGGPNPNHTDKAFYKKYIQSIEKRCQENNFLITGFVTEKDIPYYYTASDVVVFPYRNFMSASGPLSMAFGFKKPFLISQEIEGTLKTNDISEVLTDLKIKKEKIIFNSDNFEKKLMDILKNEKLKEKLELLSKTISIKRSWSNIGNEYIKLLD